MRVGDKKIPLAKSKERDYSMLTMSAQLPTNAPYLKPLLAGCDYGQFFWYLYSTSLILYRNVFTLCAWKPQPVHRLVATSQDFVFCSFLLILAAFWALSIFYKKEKTKKKALITLYCVLIIAVFFVYLSRLEGSNYLDALDVTQPIQQNHLPLYMLVVPLLVLCA